jgi:hypothetical protein
MAKLNVTADKIQLTTNMITSAVAASEWDTDAKYPSAAAVKNAIATAAGTAVCDIANAVGSVVITSTNSNPGSTLGGTWELIDKEFRSEFSHIEAAQAWDEDEANANGYISRANHTICLKAWFNFNTTVDLATSPSYIASLGTLLRTKVGIKSNGSFSYSNEGFAVHGYKPNGDGLVVRGNMRGDGYLTIDNIYGSDKVIPAGSVIHLTLPIQISMNDMDDAYCDKFYWKRTA